MFSPCDITQCIALILNSADAPGQWRRAELYGVFPRFIPQDPLTFLPVGIMNGTATVCFANSLIQVFLRGSSCGQSHIAYPHLIMRIFLPSSLVGIVQC